jgi:hypothetical protein
MPGADTIVLQSGQTYTLSLDNVAGNEDTAAEDDLDVVAGSTITIQGNGATIQRSTAVTCTIDFSAEAGEFRIFDVAGTGNLTLQNVTVQNGCTGLSFPAPNDGGGIFVESGGSLTLTNSTISDNRASSGGGIRNDGMLTITNSTLSVNSAAGSGGGIFNNGTVNISNATFSGNSGQFGGGIRTFAGTVTITNSTFSNNSVDFLGGGIDNRSASTVTITNSTLSGNSAPFGGGIFNDGTLTITNSTLSGNSATFFISSGGGGGIYNDEGMLTVTNSTISDNSAALDGGGIFNDEGTADLSFTTIASNSASTGGGILNNEGMLTVTNSTISGNSAVVGGGIHNTNGGTVTVTNSTISDNSAAAGGGIRNSSGTVTVTGSTISGNSAGDDGGAIDNSDTVDLLNVTISGNGSGSGSEDVGGIWNGITGTVNASFVTIANNTGSTTGAGGIFNSSGTVNIKNSIVGNNTSGGAPNCAGALTASGTNLATDGSCGMGFSNVPSTGPGGLNLGLLANNGGPTQTHALQAGSAAIDAVTVCTNLSGASVTTDQRASSRTNQGLCDAGAYEARLLTLKDDGSARCVEVEVDSQTYAFNTATTPGVLLGAAQVRVLGVTTLIQNIGGNQLRGTVRSGQGVAVLSVPSLRRIFTVRDRNLADTPHSCPGI